ncbi:hypothetical protein [Cerasicoccus arenae]|uniref:Uncharacterized protein n=1 Tax=Cerasicoccus arenae TaxID=424488 RepID=A0A8J3DAR9_9BACT|nr:hypothetical protein [Cerasicoccus arenae]MBK1859133.1 hypothetical protein [Cerasicoccus arenae]GHB98032.1 hypothetical protein GCM10007047_12500 [Cerasicoccus arenae]
MRAILRSLADDDADDSAPDVWLTHLETGWTLAVFSSGLLQLEADATKEPLRELKGDFDIALELWTILAEGDIARLLKANWREVE